MKLDSIWTQTVKMPAFPALHTDVKTDVLIIGGGLAGLLCAYRLTQAGVDCILVEAERICGKTTGNTTAKITSQHGLIYDKLLRTFGWRSTGRCARGWTAILRRRTPLSTPGRTGKSWSRRRRLWSVWASGRSWCRTCRCRSPRRAR